MPFGKPGLPRGPRDLIALFASFSLRFVTTFLTFVRTISHAMH